MKRFVCPTCGHSGEKLGAGLSIERGGKHCCAICGASIVQQEITPEVQKELEGRHSWFMFKWVFSFEALLFLFLVIVAGAAARAVS